MTDISDNELRDRLERRLAGMCMTRAMWEPLWREVSDYTEEMRGRFLTGSSWKTGEGPYMGGTPKVNSKRFDDSGIRAANVLQNGMHTGLTSPVRKWFRFATVDDDLADQQDVKLWLSTAERVVEQMANRGNLYTQLHAGYGQLGRFGIEAGVITQHHIYGTVTQTLEAGQFWAGVGPGLVVDSLYRACPMTVAQMARLFGDRCSQKVRDLYDKGSLDTVIPVMHAIEPNTERDITKLDNLNMAWTSVYWEPGCKEDRYGILERSGFDYQPFWCARWAPKGNNPYSGSPGMQALGDLRQVNRQQLRMAEGTDYLQGPPIVVPESLRGRLNMNPKGVTYAANADIENIKDLFQSKPDLQPLMADVQRVQTQVSNAFYEPLFKAIMSLEREVTAYQTAQLNSERYAQLGPVIEATGNEKLRPVVEALFAIAVKLRMLPPPPQALAGAEFKIEFVSTLAQLQRSDEIGAMAATAQFAGGFAALDPGAVDNMDIDEMIRRYSDLQGNDPETIRSADDVASLRQAREQQQQQAHAAQVAQAAAPAAKDGAQAAQILSQIDPSKLSQLQGAA